LSRMASFSVSVRRGEIEVTVHAGSVDEAVASLGDLKRVIEAAEAELRPKAPAAVTISVKRRGRSEAVLAQEIIEAYLLPSGYFSAPRSTAEVRDEIQRVSSLRLQSRKVSQALGNLYRKGLLRRTGTRGDYRYVAV
jgi:hypothetical protein